MRPGRDYLLPDETEVRGLLALLLVTDARRATRTDGRLAGYQYLPAIKADLFCRLGRTDEAADAYRLALELTANEAERAFLTERLAAVTADTG